ncbi:MAG: neuraminidase-like domain-containing protein, partial [Pleurocapsa sp. MO_192.B19]|nr:neuraminidase-like domain-containing protein [Pleurocapsa sp. MO_192.B19]
MELRIWNTALTPELIAERRYQQLIGDEANLYLWWQFDEVPNLEIPDLSGNGRVAIIPQSEQLQKLGEPITSVLPAINLSANTLERLATIRQLQERHNQPLERLTALWFSIKHVGQEDGQTLYDRLFNPTSLAAEPWPYYPYPPIRWDVTGQENQRRDREIRSRLMAALQVSSQDLDRIVEYLSGSETPVELDNTYLTQLYGIAQIARTLRLQVQELFRLLELIELPRVNTLEDFQQVSDRAELMRRIGISIDELDFLMNDIQSDRIRLSYTDTDIRNLADELTRQSIEFLIRVNSFVSDEISEFLSTEIIEQLEKSGLLQTVGNASAAISENQYSATNKYQEPGDLEELAIEQNWSNSFAILEVEGVDINIFTRLQEVGFVDLNGIILRQDLDQFSEAFRDENDNLLLNPTDLANIQDVLERQNNLQTGITETLVRSRDEHANAVLAGLSELLRVEAEPLQAVIDYFQSIGEPLSDRTLLLERLMAIEENQPIPTDINDYLDRLSKILFLVAEFDLSTTETQALLRNPEQFSVSDVFRPNLTDLTNLFTFSELKSAFNDVEGNLIQIFQQTQPQDIINRIFELTNWEPRQIEALMTHFGSDIAYNRVAGLNRLRQGFELAEILQTNISFPIQLANTENLTLQFYQQQSSALLPVLRARYDDEQWPRVYKPLGDRLAFQKRDALLSLAVYQSIPEDFEGRRSPDLLSEYLLLDVQVSTEVETSHIVQGTAALQLYVQRCLMSLEKGVNPATIPADQWEWMKNYRVWEANRKVFLYPESFIEPELRDTKTPLFEELEQELMQNDINQDSVTQAYMNYLNQFAEVANLKIVGSYLHRDSDDNETLYLVGRTNTQPGIHYYREYLVNDSRWLPWKKIDLTINSEIVTPVIAFGRLFLFWVEFVESSESVGSESNERSITVFQTTVQFSFLNVNGTWIQPQTYDLGIRTAADTPAVQEALSPTSSAYNEVQSFVGGLQPNAVNRSQLEEMLNLVEIYGQSLRDAAATLDQINTNTNEESEQLEQIENRINDQATNIEKVTRQFRDALSQSTGFISIIFDSFAAVFINSFDNFADSANAALANVPALLSTITVRGLTLSTAQRNQYEWQRVYAQQAVQFDPNPPTEQIEGNARVLEIAQTTNINLPIPSFSMGELTWSFWVNFINPNPNGTVERRENTITLFSYNNQAVRVTASNNVTAIPGVQAALDAANQAIQAVQVVVNNANAPTNSVPPQETVETNANAAVTSVQTAVEQARNADRASGLLMALEQLATSVQPLQQAASNGDLTQRPLSSTTASLVTTASNNLNEVSGAIATQIQYESRSTRLTLSRASSPPVSTEIELGFDRWHHIAITMRHETGGYIVRLYRDGDFVEEQAFAQQALLPSAQRVAIGQQTIDKAQAGIRAQLSEFRLWSEVREENTIRDERDERKTGQEANLRLHLPLNQEISDNSTLTFVRSVLIFRFRQPFTPVRERERLILFYGSNNEIIRTRRNNQNDQSFNLVLVGQAQGTSSYDLTLSTNFELYVGQNRQLITDNFDSVTANSENTLLRNLIANEAVVRDVHNQPGWYVLDTGDEQFLLQADVGNEELMTVAERLELAFADNRNLDSQPVSLSLNLDPALQARDNDNLPRFRFTRLSTFAVHQLIATLFRGGTDELLSLATQQSEEVDFNLYDANPQLVIAPPRSISDTIDFDGAYGLYYWEIFFHIPF